MELISISLEGLLENNRTEAAISLIKSQFDRCQTYHQAEQLLGLLDKLPADFAQQPAAQQIYLQTLCRARKPRRILEWFEQNGGSGSLLVYRAWALVRENHYAEALQLLEAVRGEPTLDWGIFYRSKGEALFWLGESHWQEVLEQARPHLKGAALGRMLVDLGGFLNARDQRAAARVCWAEALGYLEDDPYYLAWIHNSIGYSLLKDQPVQAERHLLEAVRISKKDGAKAFRSKAQAGLGAVRRGLGEWERALYCYQQAYKAVGDGKDRQLALWGWGHTLRLMGRVEEGLARLNQALQLNPREVWIEADLAAAYLMLGESQRLEESLPRLWAYQQAQQLGERGRIVRQILEAEVARRAGDVEQAQQQLAGLERHNLWVQEELGCFPMLARLVDALPEAASRRYRVEVKPFGRLEVRVNGRPVLLPAVSKAGELLVFLLANGREASLEVLLDRLADPNNKNPRKALWEVIEKLRQALGWKDSLRSCGGVYALDPQTEWLCSLEPPLSHDGQLQEFMPGYYNEWIAEWRQQWLVV